MSLSIPGLAGGAYHVPPSTDRAAPDAAAGERRPPARPRAVGADATDAEADHDVDPRLWALLSADERGFYLRSAASGPFTYGPASKMRGSVVPGRQVGGRIDVRG